MMPFMDAWTADIFKVAADNAGLAGAILFVSTLLEALLVVGLLIPILGVMLGAGALGMFLLVAGWLHAQCKAPVAATVFHPLGAWIVAHSMFEAARDLDLRRPVRWGGKEYVLTPRPLGGYDPPPTITE